MSCASNLTQIVKACVAYQQTSGDFFPAFEQGVFTDPPYNPEWPYLPPTDGDRYPNNIPEDITNPTQGHECPTPTVQGADQNFQPMPSLACLYPGYLDNIKVFACPSTSDRPQIAIRYYNGAEHICFGFTPDPGETGTISTSNRIPGQMLNIGAKGGYAYAVDPALYTGNEVAGNAKCSYFYDELSNFRDVGPSQAMAADADGYSWVGRNGKRAPYNSPGLIGNNPQNMNPQIGCAYNGWTRITTPNHNDGQNVMYFDGHVRWSQSNYASRDPNDNIYNPQGDWWYISNSNSVLIVNCDPGNWNPDTDAYLWDGSMGDSALPGT
jgi:prepilin-type processing-associated H-X9-DG protein